MSKLDELKAEANDLGVTFSPNIGEEALQKKINDHMDARGAASVAAIVAPKKEKEKEPTKELSPEEVWRRAAKFVEEKARAGIVVTIIDNDPRENHVAQTVTVTGGSAEYSLGTAIYPLNTPVLVKQGHLDVLKDIMIPMHVLDSASGQMQTVMRKRYSISTQ
jgi:hypothetical protein